jgi:hypothetical protein
MKYAGAEHHALEAVARAHLHSRAEGITGATRVDTAVVCFGAAAAEISAAADEFAARVLPVRT